MHVKHVLNSRPGVILMFFLFTLLHSNHPIQTTPSAEDEGVRQSHGGEERPDGRRREMSEQAEHGAAFLRPSVLEETSVFLLGKNVLSVGKDKWGGGENCFFFLGGGGGLFLAVASLGCLLRFWVTLLGDLF